MQAADVKEFTKSLKPGDRYKVVWSTANDPQPVTWTGEVRSKPRENLALVVYLEAKDTKQEYELPPGDTTKIHTLTAIAESTRPTMESGRLDVTSSGIIPWQPLTWSTMLKGNNALHGRTLLLDTLKGYFGYKDRADQREDWLASDHEKCVLGEVIRNWVILTQSLSDEQASSKIILAIIEPVVLRLCALKRGEGLRGEDKKEAMNAVHGAHFKLVFKDDPLSKLMMTSHRGEK